MEPRAIARVLFTPTYKGEYCAFIQAFAHQHCLCNDATGMGSRCPRPMLTPREGPARPACAANSPKASTLEHGCETVQVAVAVMKIMTSTLSKAPILACIPSVPTTPPGARAEEQTAVWAINLTGPPKNKPHRISEAPPLRMRPAISRRHECTHFGNKGRRQSLSHTFQTISLPRLYPRCRASNEIDKPDLSGSAALLQDRQS
jgi:hypothetical protein